MTDGNSGSADGGAEPSIDDGSIDGGATESGSAGRGAVADAVRARRCVAVALADGRVVDATVPLDDALGVDPAVAAGEADFYDGLAAAATDGGPVERVAAAAAEGAATDGTAVAVETDAGRRVFRHVGLACPPDSAADRLALFEDVTRARERADRLDLFETLAERARDGLFATDGAGRIAHCNESFASWLGADPATLVGRPVERFVAERERPAWAAAVGDLDPETELTREFEFRWRGPRVGLSVALTGRPGGGVLGAVRRPGHEAERADRVEQYRTLVENAADPMWVVDADDRIALANAAMGEFLGADPADLEGLAVSDPVPAAAAERIDAALETVRAGDRRRWHDTDLRLPDAEGRDRRFEATFGPVRADGAVVGTVGTFRDVTERERRRTELERLRRLLAGVVRTDIADGVREIGDLAGRLAETVDGEPATLAAAIRDRADALAALVSKTAAVDRIVDTDPEPTTVALDEAVDRAVASVDGGAAATVDVDVPSVDVRAVPVVDLAVRNLLDNALRHAGEAPAVSVTAAVDERSVTLSVADDGPGIPDAELAALERGAETPLEHGSGVGLWLVEWVVAKSGGDLSFATDDGTRATVRFDRADAADGPLSGSDDEGARTADRGDADVRVCHLDPDRSATARIREAAAGVGSTVAVERAGGVDGAVDALATGRVDCLVTDRLDDPGWDRLADAAAAADAPVVCYAGAAHAGDEARLTAVDSLVEKGTGTAPAAFLVEKVLALVGADGDARREGDTGAEAAGSDSEAAASAAGPSAVEVDETAEPSAGAALRVATDAGTVTRVPDGHPGFDDAADPPADGEGAAVTTATVGTSRRRVGEWAPTLSVDGDDLRVRYARDLTPAVARERRCALLSALVDHARDRVSVIDANGEVVYHNEAFADALGHEDMVGVHSAEFMAPGELEKGQLAVQRLLATPELDSEALDVAFETADGDRVTLAVHFAVRREAGEYAGVVNVARDVTGAAADPRLERYRTLVESAGDPMFVVDADGRLALVNEALERLLGRPRSALRGTHVEAAFPTVTADGNRTVDGGRGSDGSSGSDDEGGRDRDPDGDAEEWWRPAGVDQTFCARVRGADGDRHRYELTVADPDAFDGAVCTCREVTARERRAAELARLKRVLGRVLRHNLRNELTLVTGHAQLVADALADGDETGGDGAEDTGDGTDDTDDTDDPLALARSIQRASDDLAATATTARTAERALGPGDTERTQSLSAVVDAAAEAAAERRRPVAVSATLPPECSVVAPPSLVTALEALFGALARDSDADAPTVRVRASEADGRVDVRVSLPGSGIDRETVDPFVAREVALDRHGDAGAWLFAWVVDRADGRARLDESDEPSAVVVSLPAADDAPAGDSPTE
ncbi:PAS domain S-box protein [Halosimplex pelagicum]|uniref:histidine kinase n=1 Tax=Halosimplex pelagicum TaxID=869886 RepID=A0A7D5P964_9EURY|nr:PAS domain S-box protein [Halosimplex pelagicum]QLH80358.1 PAS domain S-box protein [Halosimplex pelagicum]